MATPKHFLDLDQVDPKTLRQILDHGKAMKKHAPTAVTTSRWAARRSP